MRSRWISGLLVAAFAAVPAFAQGPAKPVAVVNGEAIPRSDYEAVKSLRPVSPTPLTAAQKKAEAEQIIAALVDDVLLKQFLTKHAPPAKPGEVDQQFKALVEGLKVQKKTLEDYCKETQQTEKQIRANIEAMSRWSAYVAQSRSDADLQQYYRDNKDYFDRVTVKCNHILFRFDEKTPQAERDQTIKKLRDLRAQIVSGKITFAEAAQKFSQCPSGQRGGNLGYIYRKWAVEEPFAKAAFALKVNEISDVVITDYGCHIIQVTDRKPPEPSDYNKIKDDVRDCCGEEMRLNLLDNLHKTAKIEMNIPQ